MNIKIGILNVPKHYNKHDLIHFVTEPVTGKWAIYTSNYMSLRRVTIKKVYIYIKLHVFRGVSRENVIYCHMYNKLRLVKGVSRENAIKFHVHVN